jgi:trehalose-phosphatase
MLEKIASAHTRILMMDYDGTLAPFVDSRQRDKAVPYPGVLKALTAIQAAGRAHLVIVSGRAIEDLKPLLTLDTPLEIWGIHGWERQFADGVYQGPEIENKAKESFAEARRAVLASGLGFAPVDLEPKPSKEPVSLALHWRGQDPDRIAALEASVRELWEPLAESASLQLTNFDGGLELMLPGKDKGLAVRTILSEAKPGALAVYLGDEETDEDAFKAIEEPGFGILIRSEYRPTAATFWLKPPDELLQFLKHWT